MVTSCEECCSSFLDLYNELLYVRFVSVFTFHATNLIISQIQEDIHEDINLCEQQIKEEEKSKNRLKVAHRITQAVTLVAAAAASLMGAFFAFGTPLVAIPLAFSVISPIISFNINNRIEGDHCFCSASGSDLRLSLSDISSMQHEGEEAQEGTRRLHRFDA